MKEYIDFMCGYMAIAEMILIAIPLFLVSITILTVFHFAGKTKDGKGNSKGKWHQWLAVMFSQITVSPFAFVWLRKWGILKNLAGRIVVLALSPLCICLICCIGEGIHHHNYRQNYPYANAGYIESITECSLPEFKVKTLTLSPPDFHGDFVDSFTLEFSEIPDEEFYHRLDSLVTAKADEYEAIWERTPECALSKWECEDGLYRFHYREKQFNLELNHPKGSQGIQGRVSEF